MYGDLGSFKDVLSEANGFNPLGGVKHIHHLDYISRNIKTIHERDNLSNRDEVIKMFIKAERIYFMGFGFAPENLKALQLDKIDFSKKEIFSTGLGLEDEIFRRIEVAPQSFKNGFYKFLRDVVPEKAKFEELNCFQLLKKYL